MTNAPNYRHSARLALARAKAELAATDPERLRYAALEFRNVLEALTYDRAQAYNTEIPPEKYREWRPRKLMMSLLAIDPHIGMTSTIAIGLEDEPGKPAPRENMKLLGTDHALTLENLRKHYDAFGSYLHIQPPTGKEPDWPKLRQRCETVAGIAETILSSRVWNSTMGNFATLDECMNEDCKKPIRKRLPPGVTSLDVQCFECKAEYTLTPKDDGTVFFQPKMTDVLCANPECKHVMALWPHEIKPGTHWRCRECGTHSGIALSVEKIGD